MLWGYIRPLFSPGGDRCHSGFQTSTKYHTDCCSVVVYMFINKCGLSLRQVSNNVQKKNCVREKRDNFDSLSPSFFHAPET